MPDSHSLGRIEEESELFDFFGGLELFGVYVAVKFITHGGPDRLYKFLGIDGERNAYVHVNFWAVQSSGKASKVPRQLLV